MKSIAALISRGWLLITILGSITPHAYAQLAPTGDHYAGRPSDTGFGGTLVNATGGFATAIPLELPPARGGLPMPLQITYGGRDVGAAGQGWELPLSYVQFDRTFAHRRPEMDPGALPTPRQRAYLSLSGQKTELMPDGNAWVARSGTLELMVRESGDSWLAYDGMGRTYTFQRPAQLGNTGLWLLKSISAPGGNDIQLSYQVTTWPLDGGHGLAIDLLRIDYNKHPVDGCAKHEIALTYGYGSVTPLSISVLGDKILVRKNALTLIDVNSRPTCDTPYQRLRRYELQYLPDADTQLPRLQAVRMFGRQGTPEENTALPIATYGYGSATQPDSSTQARTLQYDTQTIDFPPGLLPNQKNHISGTALDSSVNAPVSGDRYAMWQTLIDVTGDGRPDFVFQRNNQLWVAFNGPGPNGTTTLGVGQAPAQLSDTTFANGAFSTLTTAKRRYDYGPANRNTTNVWRQAVDVNGDGRIDIIDAAEEADHWVVYLNTPGGPTGVKWERRSFSVRNLRLALISGGHDIEGPYVPLSRRATGTNVQGWDCWLWDGTKWSWWSQGFSNHACEGTENEIVSRGPERTFVEWELIDLNGDGYPDFVFNSSPVDFQLNTPPPPVQHEWCCQISGGLRWHMFEPRLTNEVRASFNVVGVRFDTNADPFSRSVNVHAAPPGDGTPTSVGEWRCTGAGRLSTTCDESHQSQLAGFADVNGDGLLDRVVGNRAHLGAYAGTAVIFSSVYVTLPGPLATQQNTHKEQCDTQGGGQKPTVDQTQGLRDLTGDGIPDYFDKGLVWIGTGTGFLQQPVHIKMVSGVAFRFSHQTEACDGSFSHTDGGLFDIDGDGRPEIIGLGDVIFVSQLVGGSAHGIPEAGRLTEINNGYGGKTRISYASAKDDAHSTHQVPFPEIVVSATDIIGEYGFGGTLAGVRYAYGNAALFFDSASDAFTFPGYQREVEVRPTGGDRAEGFATVTDRWPLTAFSSALTKQERWLRTQRVGRVRDLYTLRASGTSDPGSLLGIDVNDTRVIGVSHYEWDTKLYEAPFSSTENVFDCLEMFLPLDYVMSVANNFVNGIDRCRAHGFAYAMSTTSWYGGSPPPSVNNVQTASRVRAIDDFGRPNLSEYKGDSLRGDDDACIESTYATPIQSYPRVLTALASERVTDCDAQRITYAKQSWEYDNLTAGLVSNGRKTSHSVERRTTDNGTLLTTVRRFDASYDGVGNVLSVSTQRNGSTRTATFEYDPFALVQTRTRVESTGVPSTESSATIDQVSLELLAQTDMNQTQRGAEFDGFSRPLRSTATPAGGQTGVLSAFTYQGFGEGDTSGRSIVIKSFGDPVPGANVASAPGRTTTVLLDELGRERRSEVALGSDYANQILIVGARNYDPLGRVAFEADPYPTSANPATAYGTSYHYKRDGEPACFIRGHGQQALTYVPDIATELLPTCFQRSFDNHVDTLEVQDAASLQAGSAQFGVTQRIVTSAIGRPLEYSTVKAGVRLDHATFTHDHLGQLTSITRYQDPVGASNPVQWSWLMDSTGKILSTQEPAAVSRAYEYSDWGEMTESRWTDGAVVRQLVRRFDALGRLTAAEERNDGVVDPDTVNTYAYDVGVASPHLTPDHVLGRLAFATSPTGQVAFSYDAYGNMNARVFTDSANQPYVQRTEYHADGRLATLDFQLPDNNFDLERAKYDYDSAYRLRSVSYGGASGSRQLYRAESIDPLGHVRSAMHGGATYHAAYSNGGRNLLLDATIESAQGARRLSFLGYDPVGREQVRREVADGAADGPKTNAGYDSMGRLSSALQTQGATTLGDRQVTYDALGNIVSFADSVGNLGATLSYDSVDRDRLCRIDYGGLGGTACNVVHDVLGNVINQPTRNGTRQLSYFASGAVRSIGQQGAQAAFRYDPFGQVQQLDVTGTGIQDARHDRRFGDLIERRDETVGGTTTSQILRHVPGPAGTLATRLGTRDAWIFQFGEQRGNRVFTDENGAFVQDVYYEPFGEAKSSGTPAGAANYTSYQWNDRDALAAFGLSQLGARLYDPVIGRFLSRDPLVIPRSASNTNPYAFAMNDPLNASDPSGLDEGDNPLPPIVPFPGGGWWPNNFCFSILCSPPPLPPAPDLWNLSVQKSLSGDPAIAPSVTARLLTLAGLAALGQITKGKASSVFQDFIRKQIYSNQHGQGTFGFCACATRQMALKYADIIQLGLSYAAIKQGLWSETSTLLPNPPDWEHYHFNWTVKQGSKPLFSHPDKLGPDAIAQIAQNQSVGTGNTERLRWKPLTVEEARRFLDEGALVAIYVQPHGPDSGHWMAMIRDPFAGAYVYLDPYANTRPDELLTSRSMTFAPGGWDSVFEYHALVHE